MIGICFECGCECSTDVDWDSLDPKRGERLEFLRDSRGDAIFICVSCGDWLWPNRYYRPKEYMNPSLRRAYNAFVKGKAYPQIKVDIQLNDGRRFLSPVTPGMERNIKSKRARR